MVKRPPKNTFSRPRYPASLSDVARAEYSALKDAVRLTNELRRELHGVKVFMFISFGLNVMTIAALVGMASTASWS